MIARRRSPIRGHRCRPAAIADAAIGEVMTLVAFESGLPIEQIVAPHGRSILVEARAAMALLAYTHTRASVAEIGAAIGGRSDASVYDLIERADELLASDADFRVLARTVAASIEAAA